MNLVTTKLNKISFVNNCGTGQNHLLKNFQKLDIVLNQQKLQ